MFSFNVFVLSMFSGSLVHCWATTREIEKKEETTYSYTLSDVLFVLFSPFNVILIFYSSELHTAAVSHHTCTISISLSTQFVL